MGNGKRNLDSRIEKECICAVQDAGLLGLWIMWDAGYVRRWSHGYDAVLDMTGVIRMSGLVVSVGVFGESGVTCQGSMTFTTLVQYSCTLNKVVFYIKLVAVYPPRLRLRHFARRAIGWTGIYASAVYIPISLFTFSMWYLYTLRLSKWPLKGDFPFPLLQESFQEFNSTFCLLITSTLVFSTAISPKKRSLQARSFHTTSITSLIILKLFQSSTLSHPILSYSP